MKNSIVRSPKPISSRSVCSMVGLIAGLLATAAAHAQEVQAPQEFTQVRDYIDRELEHGLAPSVAVAVIKNGSVVWSEGFGYADIEHQVKSTPQSIYRLASISKPITATGLMILKDRGLVELDAPVNQYINGAKLRAMAGPAEAMTVRRLANHTSGMPLHYNFFYPGTPIPSMDETIRRYGFAATPPGSDWQYSNLAFGILGYVTELRAEMPWRAFLERNLFDPLGMSHTTAGVRPDCEADATVQYTPDAAGKFVAVPHYEFDHPGASAIWSSAADLTRFVRMHLGGGELDGVRVLSAESAREMQMMTTQRDDGTGNGIAWFVGTVRGHNAIWHSGGMPGVSTMIRLFPDDNAATIVLTNTDRRAMTNEVTERLTRVLFPESGAAKKAMPSNPPQQEPVTTGVWRGEMAHFSSAIPLVVEAKAAGSVTVRLGDDPAQQLRDLVLRGDSLRGTVSARVRTQDGFYGIPTVELQLRRRGDRMTGVAIAQANGYFALSHWVDLKEDPGSGPAVAKPAAASSPSRGQGRAASLDVGSLKPDILLRNGRIVDGCGTPWYVADLAIRDGRIVAIGRLTGLEAGRTIDCTGLTVAPGFIDMMGQTASPFLADPAAGLNLLTQGITTINCGEGTSAAPLGDREAKEAGWSTMAEYFARLEKAGMPMNMVQTIGHTQVRSIVIGEVDRKATPQELERMKGLVREAMEAGAIGVSTALIYPPAVYAPTEEIVALVRVAGEYGGRYYTHMRNEGDRLLEAIDEALEIGRSAGTPVHIYHLKTAGRANWGKMDLAIARIQAARTAGQQVAADVYPYINNGLGLRAFIHPRHAGDGLDALRRRLLDSNVRQEIRREMEQEGGWENWFRHIGSDWDNVVLSGITLEAYAVHNGKSLGEIARSVGKDPWDVFFEIARADAFALPQSMSEANKIKAMRQEFISFDTDVGPAGGSRVATHPRAFGSFPRVLSRYVRELGALSLEQAIARMTSVAANELMLYDRGRLAVGLPADVVVFDFDHIRDRATLAKPDMPSEGMRYVIVNGQVVLDGDRYTGLRPGRVLRRGQSAIP